MVDFSVLGEILAETNLDDVGDRIEKAMEGAAESTSDAGSAASTAEEQIGDLRQSMAGLDQTTDEAEEEVEELGSELQEITLESQAASGSVASLSATMQSVDSGDFSDIADDLDRMSHTMQRGFEEGLDDFVGKPAMDFDPQEVFAEGKTRRAFTNALDISGENLLASKLTLSEALRGSFDDMEDFGRTLDQVTDDSLQVNDIIGGYSEAFDEASDSAKKLSRELGHIDDPFVDTLKELLEPGRVSFNAGRLKTQLRSKDTVGEAARALSEGEQTASLPADVLDAVLKANAGATRSVRSTNLPDVLGEDPTDLSEIDKSAARLNMLGGVNRLLGSSDFQSSVEDLDMVGINRGISAERDAIPRPPPKNLPGIPRENLPDVVRGDTERLPDGQRGSFIRALLMGIGPSIINDIPDPVGKGSFNIDDNIPPGSIGSMNERRKAAKGFFDPEATIPFTDVIDNQDVRILRGKESVRQLSADEFDAVGRKLGIFEGVATTDLSQASKQSGIMDVDLSRTFKQPYLNILGNLRENISDIVGSETEIDIDPEVFTEENTEKIRDFVDVLEEEGLNAQEAVRLLNNSINQTAKEMNMLDANTDSVEEADNIFEKFNRSVRESDNKFGAFTRTLGRMSDNFEELDVDMQRFARSASTLGNSFGNLSANIGPFNIAIQNVLVTIPALIATIGPLVSLLLGLATALVAVTGAFVGLLAVGAIGFTKKIEENFAGIKNTTEALEAIFQGLQSAIVEALRPLRSVEIAGLGPQGIFVTFLRDIVRLIHMFAEASAELLEMDVVQEFILELRAALLGFSDATDNGLTMIESLKIVAKEALPVLQGLLLWFIDILPEMLAFSAQITNDLAPALGQFLTSAVKLIGVLTKLGTGVLQNLLPILSAIIETLVFFAEVTLVLSDIFGPLLEILVLVAAITGSLLFVTTKLAGALVTLSFAYTVATEALIYYQAALDTASASTKRFIVLTTTLIKKLFLVVLAIGLIVSGINILRDTFEPVDNFFTGIENAISAAIDPIVDFFVGITDTLGVTQAAKKALMGLVGVLLILAGLAILAGLIVGFGTLAAAVAAAASYITATNAAIAALIAAGIILAGVFAYVALNMGKTVDILDLGIDRIRKMRSEAEGLNRVLLTLASLPAELQLMRLRAVLNLILDPIGTLEAGLDRIDQLLQSIGLSLEGLVNTILRMPRMLQALTGGPAGMLLGGPAIAQQFTNPTGDPRNASRNLARQTINLSVDNRGSGEIDDRRAAEIGALALNRIRENQRREDGR